MKKRGIRLVHRIFAINIYRFCWGEQKFRSDLPNQPIETKYTISHTSGNYFIIFKSIYSSTKSWEGFSCRTS